MINANTKLKPLKPKQSLDSNRQQPNTLMSHPHKLSNKPSFQSKKPIIDTKPTTTKVVTKRPEKNRQRSTKTIQFYDCNDFDNPMVDQQEYFRGQIQKNIKTEIMNSTNKVKTQPKNQIVLPKLESDIKSKPLKDLQRQMDLQMSAMMEKQMNDF